MMAGLPLLPLLLAAATAAPVLDADSIIMIASGQWRFVREQTVCEYGSDRCDRKLSLAAATSVGR